MEDFNYGQKVLVRDGKNETWEIGTFCEKTGYGAYRVTQEKVFYHCIPYCKNEHLSGETFSSESEEANSFHFGDKVYLYLPKKKEWQAGVVTKNDGYNISVTTSEETFTTNETKFLRHEDW